MTSIKQTNRQPLSDLEQQGYQLTTPLNYTLPHSSPAPTLSQSFWGMFGEPPRRPFSHRAPKKVTVLNQKVLILTQGCKLIVLHYSVVKNELTIENKGCFLLSGQIQAVAVPHYNSSLDKRDSSQYFVVYYKESSMLSLFRVSQELTVVHQHSGKESEQVLTVQFVSNLEVIVVLRSGLVRQYVVEINRLKRMRCEWRTGQSEGQQIVRVEVCVSAVGQRIQVTVFYITKEEGKLKGHQRGTVYRLHCLQFWRDSPFKLTKQGAHQNILQPAFPQQLIPEMGLTAHKDVFLLSAGRVIFLLQKRHGQYKITDEIDKSIEKGGIRLIDKKDHMFLASVGRGEIELWRVELKEVGCHCRLLDVVEADGAALMSKMLAVWIFVAETKPELIVLTDAGLRSVDFCLTRRRDKLSKLVEWVRRQETGKKSLPEEKRNFSAHLQQVESLGATLGFKQREFYLELWHRSDKQAHHISEYLLPCRDFEVIFHELTYYLRIHKLPVTEIIRILKKIQAMLRQQLEHSLTSALLTQYLKTNFQRRKLNLYSGEVLLDWEEYQKLYGLSLEGLVQKQIDLKLFPWKFHHKITWKQQPRQIRIQQISRILQEFRLVILEDYPGFLKRVLQPYSQNLAFVIGEFPELFPQYPLKISIVREQLVMLSNIYAKERQRIAEDQYSWLGFIREKEWEREKSSYDGLYRLLYPHHKTSDIVTTLTNFMASSWCTANRYVKHVLVGKNRAEFEVQLPLVSDATTLLLLCQECNRVALTLKSINEGPAVLKIMQKYNNLPKVQCEQYTLLSRMHHLLLQQRLIPSEMTILQLQTEPWEKVITYFFLGRHQRIHLLFGQAKWWFPDLTAFYRAIQQFVRSQECSKVELELMLDEARESLEEDETQLELIQIIMAGFMGRIQLRELDKANDFLSLFRNLLVSEGQLLQIATFEGIKRDCRGLFRAFGMQSFTYESIMHDSQMVVKELVERYFTRQRCRSLKIALQGTQLPLEYPRNLFAVVLYLKDKVYGQDEEMGMYLTFSQSILTWNQFQLFEECFSHDPILPGLSNDSFRRAVVGMMLQSYHEDEAMLYSAQNKEHIRRLVMLDCFNSPAYVVETAKMAFAEVLQEVGHEVTVQYMEMLRWQWMDGDTQEAIFMELIDMLYEQVSFGTFSRMYEWLEQMRDGGSEVVKGERWVRMAEYLCRKLQGRGKYLEVCDIICFLNEGERSYRASASVMSECMLRVLWGRMEREMSLGANGVMAVVSQGEMKQYCMLVDYYLDNYKNMRMVNALFQQHFQNHIYQEQPASIAVDRLLQRSERSVQIDRVLLWEASVKATLVPSIPSAAQLSRIETQQSLLQLKSMASHLLSADGHFNAVKAIAVYYLLSRAMLSMGDLMELEGVSYQHCETVQALGKIGQSQFMNIDLHCLYLTYLKGLFKLYCVEQEKSKANEEEQGGQEESGAREPREIGRNIEAVEEEKIMRVARQLTPISLNNKTIYRSIKKLVALMDQLASTPHQLPQTQRLSPRLVVDPEPELLVPRIQDSVTHHLAPPVLPRLERSFTYAAFSKFKSQMGDRSFITCERAVNQKVLFELSRRHDTEMSREEPMPESGDSILSALGHEMELK